VDLVVDLRELKRVHEQQSSCSVEGVDFLGMFRSTENDELA
jgi:hypothetical protein